MSVLQAYLSWTNSVLCEANRSVEGVSAIQEGKVLCELIDILAPETGLLDKVQASGAGKQRAYIHRALDHMKSHGIKIVFSTQDIMDGDIKSLLDVMWLLILNYGIHFIGENSFQRTVGVGKKILLDWCQGELDVTFDPKVTLAIKFTSLLQVFAGSHIEETEDKVAHLNQLLQEIEERYGIHRQIVSSNDLIDGTVDEHTLMIYLSLLKRRVCSTVRSARREMLSVDGKEAALARVEERNRSFSEEAETRRRYSEQIMLHKQFLQQQQQPHHHQQQDDQEQQQQQTAQASRNSRALSLNSSLALPVESFQARSQESLESNWMSSESNSQVSGQDRSSGDRKSSLVREAEQVLLQTISEKVHEHVPSSDNDQDRDTDVSQGGSFQRESESVSELSSGAFDEGYVTLRTDTTTQNKNAEENIKDLAKSAVGKAVQFATKSEKSETKTEKPVPIKINRPKDYYLQWEETLDRLSQVPPSAPDVSDMSPRSPRQILKGISRSSRSRSESDDQEVYGEPVWKRKEYLERRSGSPASDSRSSSRLPRSSSMPTGASHDSSSDSQDRLNRSVDNRRRTRSARVLEEKTVRRERGYGARKKSTEGMQDSQGHRQELSAQAGHFRSNFMNTLEELQKSGKAKRVVLPELGPDTPVVMVPTQGKEVLLLVDTLRQARLDVDGNITLAGGATNGTHYPASNRSRSPTRISPTQQSEETEVKEGRQKEGTVSGGSPTHQEEGNFVGSLPRPKAHKHRVPKPMDIRVADLRSGRSRDLKRTQSLTERITVSPLVAASNSPRYHSLSPRRERDITSPPDYNKNLAPSPVNRRGASSRAVSWDRFDNVEDAQRSSNFRQLAQRGSPYTSPYRSTDHRSGSHSQNRLRTPSPRHSPRVSRIVERPPPLELPEDMVSPRPRVGGLGRIPRREAWERQRKRREIQSLDNSGAESSAQGRFIEVLYKEIAELKHKIEIMEDSQVESSPERGSPRRGWTAASTPTSTGNNDSFFTAQSEIRETENRMILTRRRPSPRMDAQESWQSPRYSETRSSSSPPRLSPRYRPVQTSLSPRRPYTTTSTLGTFRDRQSPSPHRLGTSDLSPRPRSISLGYKSPIRSVTQEIWGGDLTETTDSVQSERREHYRKLISLTSSAEKNVIELKQALASSVVENDILQAKLRNARYDIEEKLNKTNEVLDGCRKHLAKSQAENMELRTALERDKERAQQSETYCQDLQQIVQQVRADNQELEAELDYTASMLNQSRPGLEALKEQNQKLRGQTSHVQNENSSLKREMDDLQKGHLKSVHTTRELRRLLDEVREERSSLQQQLNKLKRAQSDSRLRTVLSSNYSNEEEKGARDEVEHEPLPSTTGGVASSSADKFSAITTSPTRRTTSITREPSSTRSFTASTPNVSTTHPRSSSPTRGLSYRHEDLSPVQTSREIYPHRKPRYQSASWRDYDSPERRDSPVNFIDYPDLEHYPTKLPNFQDDYSLYRSSSRDISPIYKPIPYRPYQVLPTTPTYSKLPGDSVRDSWVRSPDFRGRSPKRTSPTLRDPVRESRGRSPALRGRSPNRTSPSLRDSRSASSSPGLPSDRLSRSHDSVLYRTPRSASCSPGRSEDGSWRGILKRGGSREATPSPRYGSRSHSPPTRLSPELGKRGCLKKLSFSPTDGLSQSGQWKQERPWVDKLRQKHSSTSWFHLQLPPTDIRTGLPKDQTQNLFSREEKLLLSDDQRRYANSLIKKYTGFINL
ncbi:hypothetical protein ACOMHN_026736 [Nucella lapillus]